MDVLCEGDFTCKGKWRKESSHLIYQTDQTVTRHYTITINYLNFPSEDQ